MEMDDLFLVIMQPSNRGFRRYCNSFPFFILSSCSLIIQSSIVLVADVISRVDMICRIYNKYSISIQYLYLYTRQYAFRYLLKCSVMNALHPMFLLWKIEMRHGWSQTLFPTLPFTPSHHSFPSLCDFAPSYTCLRTAAPHIISHSTFLQWWQTCKQWYLLNYHQECAPPPPL